MRRSSKPSSASSLAKLCAPERLAHLPIGVVTRDSDVAQAPVAKHRQFAAAARAAAPLADIEEAELVLKEARLKPSGNLRVDMSVAFGRLKMVPLLSSFQAEYPDVRLSLTFTDRYVDLIEEGVDVAVRLGVLQDSSLIARRLTAAQFKVVGTPGYFGRQRHRRRLCA